MHRHIQAVRVERHRVDLVHDIVLLHVRVHHLISGELEKFPQHADRHGEAERHDSQEQRRQLEGKPFASVKQVNQAEADRRDQKSVYRVQHGVPSGNDGVERIDLAHDLGGIDKAVDDSFHHRRDVDGKLFFNQRRHRQQHERQHAYEHILIPLHERTADECQHDQKRQYAANGQSAAYAAALLRDTLL